MAKLERQDKFYLKIITEEKVIHIPLMKTKEKVKEKINKAIDDANSPTELVENIEFIATQLTKILLEAKELTTDCICKKCKEIVDVTVMKMINIQLNCDLCIENLKEENILNSKIIESMKKDK